MTDSAAYPDPAAVERDPRPIVAGPRRGAPGAVIAAVGLIAAILLFVLLNAQRQQAQAVSDADRQPIVYAPPPPLSIPVEPAARPRPVPVLAVQPIAIAQPRPPAPPPEPEDEPPPPPPPIIRDFPPPRPMPVPIQPRRSGPAEAALVLDSGGELAIGTLIPAVLETPIDTSRPGMVRAIVSQDARGQDGEKVLVPRGSRLIGEYQSDVRSGQNRVLVNWTRLIRPDGYTVRLGAPSADSMGGAGIPGNYHSFFLSRFFNAALQTALSVGGNLVGGRGDNTVIVGLPNSVGTAGQGLFQSENRRPKITVKAGTLFNVFVNREVDFSGTSTPQ